MGDEEKTPKKAKTTADDDDDGINKHTGNALSRRYYDILEKRKTLPVWLQKREFIEKLSQSQTMILVGETGSGKTTQVPQFVVDAGYTADGKMCVCTLPSRVAAMSLAKRVADEMDVNTVVQVGYSIRFDETTWPTPLFQYATDVMFLR